jgi:hypothetical protein
MGRGLAFWRGASKGSVACWTIGEGRGCAAENQLLSLRITNDNGIVMAASRNRVSISFYINRIAGGRVQKYCDPKSCAGMELLKGYLQHNLAAVPR